VRTIRRYDFKEESTAEAIVVPRVELINKVQSVRKVNAKFNAGSQNQDGEFEKMLALEQSKNSSRKNLEDMPVAIDSSVMNGGMTYYTNRAVEAYFCMTFSTTDLRG
jgi:hypothetical protein